MNSKQTVGPKVTRVHYRQMSLARPWHCLQFWKTKCKRSQYGIEIFNNHLIDLNCKTQSTCESISFSVFFLFYFFVNWSPLIKSELSFLNLLFRFLGFLFLVKYIKSWCRTIHFQYSPKKNLKIQTKKPKCMTKVYDCFRVKKKGHIGIGYFFCNIFFPKT